MRIALITTSFLPTVGGGEFVVHNLASAWQKQGHDVCVFNAISKELKDIDHKYAIKKYKVPHICLRLGFLQHRFPFDYIVSRDLKRQLEEFRPDFISAHFGYPLSIWLSKIRPLPKFLITCHGGELTEFSWGWRRRFKIDAPLAKALNDSAGTIAISRQARKLLEKLGVRPEGILDIPNGVDLLRFRKKIDSDFRTNLNIPKESIVVLSVGREHPQKAYDVGIKAFSRVAKTFNNIVYVIVGTGTSKWQKDINDLGLQERILVCEGLKGDDLVAAYRGADIFFSPSRWELMPLVVLEAMASGLPMVVTNVSGSQDLIHTGENGFIAEPDNVDAMAEMLQVLIRDEPLRERFGKANYMKAEKYSWEKISQSYLEGLGF